jgi:hypothetical protein
MIIKCYKKGCLNELNGSCVFAILPPLITLPTTLTCITTFQSSLDTPRFLSEIPRADLHQRLNINVNANDDATFSESEYASALEEY